MDRHVFHFLFSFSREKEKSTSKKLSPPLPDYILALYSRGTFVPSQEKELTSASSSHKSAKKSARKRRGRRGKRKDRIYFLLLLLLWAQERDLLLPCCHLQRRKGRRRTTLPELKFWSLRSTSSPTLFFEDEPRLGGSPSPHFPPLKPHLPFDGGEMKRLASLLVRDAGVSTKLTTSVAEEKCETDT